MELVVLIGIPATGKSTFCRERFFDTHVRVNLDMLRTRHRERLLVAACLEAKQPLVVDNNNTLRAERAAYLLPARAAGFLTVGFFFESRVADALARNRQRTGARRVPEQAIFGKSARLELPEPEEGFDQLRFVRLLDGEFVVEPWRPPSSG